MTTISKKETKWSPSVVSDSLWPMDCSLPGSLVHGIFPARVLEWVANFPSPGVLPNPGIEPGSPELQADALPSEPPGKPREAFLYYIKDDFKFLVM